MWVVGVACRGRETRRRPCEKNAVNVFSWGAGELICESIDPASSWVRGVARVTIAQRLLDPLILGQGRGVDAIPPRGLHFRRQELHRADAVTSNRR